MNAYVYCDGDPRNKADPSGHTPIWLKTFLRSPGLMNRPTQKSIAAETSIFRPTLSTQKNTQKNLQASISENGRPEKIVQIQNSLELNRQSHAFNLDHYPNTTTTYVKPSYVQIDGKYVQSRNAYSKLVVEHQNQIIPLGSAERPPTMRFADFPVVHEVERLVAMPPGGWKRVADIRKNRR